MKPVCLVCNSRAADNRMQICAKCRTRKCEKCGREFMAKSQVELRCHPCREWSKKKNGLRRPRKITEYDNYIL